MGEGRNVEREKKDFVQNPPHLNYQDQKEKQLLTDLIWLPQLNLLQLLSFDQIYKRKKGSEVSRIQPKVFLKKDERECLMKTNLCCSEKSKKITNETKNG